MDGLGLFTLVFTIYLFGMQFANFGIGAAITKYVSEDKDNFLNVRSFISKGIVSSIIIGSLMATILFLTSSYISTYIFHNNNMDILLKITALCFPFIALQKAVLGALNGLRKMKHYAYIIILHNIVIITLTIILVNILNLGLNGAILGFVCPTIAVSLLSFLLVKEYFVLSTRVFDSVFKTITSFGFYVMLGNSISMLNIQINTLLLGIYLNATDVGYFAVSTTLIQGMLLIPSSIQTISGPKFSRLNNKQDYINLKLLVKNCILYTFIIMLILSFLLIILGNQLINILFTNEYNAAYGPLVIMIIGYLFYSPFVSIGSIFANIGKVKLSFKVNLLCTFITIILNLLFIPAYGILGAAFATTLSLFFTTLINLFIIIILLRNK